MSRKLCTICNLRPAGYGTNGDQAHALRQGFCTPCLTEADHENTHSDQGHDGDSEHMVQAGSNEAGHRVEGCWECFPELNEAQKPYVKRERAGHQSPRRTQLNHKFCMHEQAPKARRDCRNAFWATNTEDFGAFRAAAWQAAGYVERDGHWVHQSVIAAEQAAAEAAAQPKPRTRRTRKTA